MIADHNETEEILSSSLGEQKHVKQHKGERHCY